MTELKNIYPERETKPNHPAEDKPCLAGILLLGSIIGAIITGIVLCSTFGNDIKTVRTELAEATKNMIVEGDLATKTEEVRWVGYLLYGELVKNKEGKMVYQPKLDRRLAIGVDKHSGLVVAKVNDGGKQK